MAIELYDFFTAQQLNTVTKSAFVQARNKIRPCFFQHLIQHSQKSFYRYFSVSKWQGLRLWAMDGTELRLPNEPVLGNIFGWHSNQYKAVPSTRILCCYDLLNELIIKVVLHSRHQAEITVASPLIQHIPKDVLLVYDRGFASYAIPFLHTFYGSYCLVRLKKSFNPTVTNFIQSRKKQLIVKTLMSERATRSLRHMGFQVNRKTPLTYRLIRVDLYPSPKPPPL